MTLVTVFTPTNNTTWLDDAWKSLSDQNVDFEWLVGVNGTADHTLVPEDARIKKLDISPWRGVGAAKKALCDAASGEFLVELDHDDILAENALTKIVGAFNASEEIGFVYSDFAEWLDETGDPFVYSAASGWLSYMCEIRGMRLVAMRAFPANPKTLSQILFSPNHVRAWRASLYREVGGHDESLEVCDDYDLVCRTYLKTKMAHIPEPLYGYRRRSDGQNTWLKYNAIIQKLCGVGEDRSLPAEGQKLPLRDKYFHKLVERWCDMRGHTKIDLGGGINGANGWTSLDVSGRPDIKWDVFGEKRLPFEDNSVGAFRAFDFLEHGTDADSLWLFDEIYRCLVPEGIFLSYTPHALGIGASCDPSHLSRWDERRFLYWCSDELRPFLLSSRPEAKAKFKPIRLYRENRQMGPSPWKFEIPYVVADLMKV